MNRWRGSNNRSQKGYEVALARWAGGQGPKEGKRQGKGILQKERFSTKGERTPIWEGKPLMGGIHLTPPKQSTDFKKIKGGGTCHKKMGADQSNSQALGLGGKKKEIIWL